MPDAAHLRVIPGTTDEEILPPHSIEAEQQVLGAILTNNAVVDRLDLAAGDFYDTVHADIYRLAVERVRTGGIASPVTLKPLLAGHPGLAQLGGPAYLVRLSGASISSHAVPDYARLIRDLRRRREILAALDRARDRLVAGPDATADVTADLEATLLAGQDERRGNQPVSWLSAISSVIEQVNAAYQGEELPIVRSGLPSLDRLITGFGAGEMWLLAGRPSMGKTAQAITIAKRAAEAGHPVVFASLEMMPDSIALRGLTDQAAGRPGAVAYSQARNGELSEDQFRNLVAAAHETEALPITFLPRSYGEPTALYMGAKQAIARMGLSKMPLVVVDYLQLMRVPGASRFEIVTAISQGLKDAAMRLECPILALSQLSRQVESREDKRPQLSDLRESGQLEQDADGVLFSYRPEYYLAREEPDPGEMDEHAAWQRNMELVRHRAEIIVAKQRQGQLGTARLRFNPALNYIWEE